MKCSLELKMTTRILLMTVLLASGSSIPVASPVVLFAAVDTLKARVTQKKGRGFGGLFALHKSRDEGLGWVHKVPEEGVHVLIWWCALFGMQILVLDSRGNLMQSNQMAQDH